MAAPVNAMIYPLAFGDLLVTNEWVEWHLHKFLDGTFVTRMTRLQRFDVIGVAVILWNASLKENPAGTLPDDDELLADKAKVKDLDVWREMRPLVLHDWVPARVLDPETGEYLGGKLCHVSARGGLGLLAQIAKRTATRKSAKAAGRETQRLATMRSRVKTKMKGMGKARFSENADLVASVTKWLDENSLFVNDENILAGLETLHNIPRVVGFGRGADS